MSPESLVPLGDLGQGLGQATLAAALLLGGFILLAVAASSRHWPLIMTALSIATFLLLRR